ncbi:MAPEG family protein [Parvibaculum sp.]|uniref:MAPEG family protein n=1 Tax=Parvibaculum sp. TaxID=2024848 RepID=UPI003210E905
MTVELWALVCSGALLFAMIAIAATANMLNKGLAWSAGNRDEAAPSTGWAGRASRAYHNMLETLPVFVILVLVAHVANIHTANAALGAQLYLWGRIAYAALYYLGIVYVRTLAWLVSVIGMAMILIEIAKAVPAA